MCYKEISDKDLLEIVEKQIKKLEKIQEDHYANTDMIIRASSVIKEYVGLLRIVRTPCKKW